jgi:inosose dehydratase
MGTNFTPHHTMSNLETLSRRGFLRAGLLAGAGTAALAQAGFAAGRGPEAVEQPAKTAFTKPVRDPFGGLKLGMASYTYRKFTLDQALEMTREAGLKYINLKDVHLPMKTSAAERQDVRRKVEAAGLVLMGGGVIYLLGVGEPEIRAAFEYVKDAGMPTMVCSPSPDVLDIVEKMARLYDVRVAINNRGPGDKYFPSPYDVHRVVKNRDQRLGICMDTGHTVRVGDDPVRVIRECGGRLYDLHLKDVTLARPEGKSTEVGRGVVDMVGVLRALVRRKFPFHAGLECDENENAPQPDVLGSVAYMRGVLAAI